MIRGHSTRSGVSLAPARGLSLDTTARPSPAGKAGRWRRILEANRGWWS
jgi:hypothetical protein